MTNLFKGGVGLVEVDPADTFDSGDEGVVLYSFDAFTKQGNTWPTPAPVKDPMHDDQELIGGWDCPFGFNALGVPVETAEALAPDGEDGTRYFVRFTSKDGKFERVVKNCVLHVWAAGIQERGVHGFVRVEGKGTGVTYDDVVEDTYT